MTPIDELEKRIKTIENYLPILRDINEEIVNKLVCKCGHRLKDHKIVIGLYIEWECQFEKKEIGHKWCSCKKFRLI